MLLDKHEKAIRTIDSQFAGHNFNYLGYEYCADPVCKQNPTDYDCPYVCDTSDVDKIDISHRYFMNLRRGFVARKGFAIVSIDYSQIELRIAANLSGEPSWVNSFINGEDLHRNVAKACFKTDDPSDKQRKLTKGFNFGSLYGGGAGTIAAATGIPFEEAQALLLTWKAAVPVLQAWMLRIKKDARKMGYAVSHFGRRRYLDTYYKSKDREQMASADRFATNHVVQATAADLLKVSILNAHNLIQTKNWQNDVKMLLTVHDEIDFEVRESMLEEVISALRPVMEFKLKKWPVPLTVDVEVSRDWGSVEKYALVKSRFEKVAEPMMLPKESYYIVPHRLDEMQVSILEAILKQYPGTDLLSLGYDGHIIDLNVSDPKTVALEMRQKKLIL